MRQREVTSHLNQVLVLPHKISFRGSFSSERLAGFPESDVLTPKDKINGDASPTTYTCTHAHTYTGISTYQLVAILCQIP